MHLFIVYTDEVFVEACLDLISCVRHLSTYTTSTPVSCQSVLIQFFPDIAQLQFDIQ